MNSFEHVASPAPALASSQDAQSGRKRLVLASGSPRRRELVKALDQPMEVLAPSNHEAARRSGEPPEDYVLRLALAKAREVAKQTSDSVVLGADTAVVLDGEVRGKPANSPEATQMLRRLRGRTHRVVTGVVALDGDSGRRVASTRGTDVTMRRYSDGEVAAYVASGAPLDKAGAYAIQDSSFQPAESVEGCYLNVVGLPLCEVVTLLAQLGQSATLRPGWKPPVDCRDCPLPRGQEAE